MKQGTSPVFSILTPVYNPPVEVLQDTIDSVLSQTYEDWELVLVDDLSPNPEVLDVLCRASAADSRIRVVTREANGGIIAASNDAVAAAQGEFLVLLDHDDLLVPQALERVALALSSDPSADYVYSDEDKLGAHGEYYDQFDKPDWSPERLRGQMYTGHLSVLRAAVVRDVGGFHTGFEGSQDHDLVLRVTERARSIVHIPEVLYHWRVVPGSAAGSADAKPYAWDAGVRAVGEHLKRVGIDATAVRGSHPGTYRVARVPELDRTVSVIIPTRGTAGEVWGAKRVFVVEAVRSLLATTGHRNLEVVVVYDVGTPDDVISELKHLAGERLTLVPFQGVFNFSKKCNLGYLASRGDVLLFLNDDVQTISEEMVGSLIAPLNEPDVGMTGAKLYFEDGFIQHAGHIYHRSGFFHAYMGEPKTHPGAFCSLLVNRETSGLTAACIAVPRSVFKEVGGFSELLPGSFNDVDFSYKVARAGLRLLWVADVELFHFESRSRNPTVHAFEAKVVFDRWGVPVRDAHNF